MRSLRACLFLLAATSVAHADDGPRFEVGAYSGGLIVSDEEQFFNSDIYPGYPGADPMFQQREQLKRFSPMTGLRFLYPFKEWLAAEAEAQIVFTSTDATGRSAKIYGARLQLMFQHPLLAGKLIPYVALGDGFDSIVSPDSVLGSDTDWAPHLGIGARYFVKDAIAVRLDLRMLRAPSMSPDYTLNTTNGELMLGVSYRFGKGAATAGGDETHLSSTADSDGDGIVDASDKCPREAEDKDLFEDGDGCPELDNDQDGVTDANDKCPTEAEDKDGFQDDDGCVDPDNDGDGVLDAQDKCPAQPEDKDNHDDEDGCPDPDNDSDGFPDGKDACPNEAEVINGNKDDDGCPDKGDSLVLVSPDRVELLEPVQFNKALILKSSANVLQQLASTLKAHPEILRVRITSFVQPTAKPDADKQLTELRAFAVREALIKYGVADSRLEPRGFGGEKPLVDPKTKNAAAINDRIELIVLERK